MPMIRATMPQGTLLSSLRSSIPEILLNDLFCDRRSSRAAVPAVFNDHRHGDLRRVGRGVAYEPCMVLRRFGELPAGGLLRDDLGRAGLAGHSGQGRRRPT